MTSQARRAWTAFTTLFFALVAMLGFDVPARNAATAPAVPAEPSALPGRTADIPAVRKAPEAAEAAPLAWWALPKDRALPPTIKQRIRAEAHGSTPGTRHVPLDSEESSEDAVAEAAVGEAVLQPA